MLKHKASLQAELDKITVAKAAFSLETERLSAAQTTKALEAQLAETNGDKLAVLRQSQEAARESLQRQIDEAKLEGNTQKANELFRQLSIKDRLDLKALAEKQKEIIKAQTDQQASSFENAQKQYESLQNELDTAKGETIKIEKRANEAKIQQYDKDIAAARKAGETAAAAQLIKNKALQLELDAYKAKKAQEDALKTATERRIELEAQLAEANGDKLATARRSQQVAHDQLQAEIDAAKKAGNKKVVKELTRVQELTDTLAFKKMQGTDVQTSHLPGFSKGGLIQGQGTETSDSILAKVSKGEFVVPAATVKKVGVEALNNLGNFSLLDKLPRITMPEIKVPPVLLNGVSSDNMKGKKDVVVVKFEDRDGSTEATFDNRHAAEDFVTILRRHKSVATGS